MIPNNKILFLLRWINNFVKLRKCIIFALSILHEQTTAKARSKLVG